MVHPRASVEAEAVLFPSAEEFAGRAAFEFPQNVVEGYIDGSVGEEEASVALLPDERIEVAYVLQLFAYEEFPEKWLIASAIRSDAAPGAESADSIVGGHFDVKGIAFVNGPYSVVEGENHGIGHRAGEEVGLDVLDFHVCPQISQISAD